MRISADAAARSGSILRREMEREPRITAHALAESLGVSDQVAHNYRSGRTVPPLDWIPRIVKALARPNDGDGAAFTTYQYLVEVGVLEPDDTTVAMLADRAIRLQKLELKLERANAVAAQWGREHGAASIVSAAVESGRWAVSVWPAFEGPEDLPPMHVADRVDIFATDLARDVWGGDDPVWADPVMRTALRASRALRGGAMPRTADFLQLPASAWSIPHIGAPRDPVVSSPLDGLPSLCFLAPSVNTWVADVAALVALALGYGMTTTRDLALDMGDPGFGNERRERQTAAHVELLASPPRRRVWSHTDAPDEWYSTKVEFAERMTNDSSIFVMIDPSPALIDDPASTWREPFRDRKRVAVFYQAVASHVGSERCIALRADLKSSRSERWSQALDHTTEVLRGLESRGVDVRAAHGLNRLAAGGGYGDDVSTPLAEWLNARGWRVD